MDGPRISILEGANSLRLNTSNQREEEEFLEEEKIRNAELQDLIINAFNNSDEDNDETDSSISSSRYSRSERSGLNHIDPVISASGSNCSSDYSNHLGYSNSRAQPDPLRETYPDHLPVINHNAQFKGNAFTEAFASSNHVSAHKNHCFHSNPSPIQDQEMEIYKMADLNGTEQMKVLYEVRLREIERLTTELDAEKEEKVQILRKLALSEHEKKNLEISLNANRTLLAESRTKISELENTISELNNKIIDIEKSKNEMRSELEITKTQLYHEQQKFAALERSDLNAKREKQMDMVIESLKSKHKSEMNSLQQHLDDALERLSKKSEDYNALEKKLDEIEEKHAASLLNKCDSAMRQESTYQALLVEANQEKIELTKQVNSLQQENAMLKNDLDQYDSFPSLRLNENNSSDEKDSDSFLLMSSVWRDESKRKGLNLNQNDLVDKLKKELHRALLSQRTKRKEISILQENIQNKEVQISNLKEKERHYLSQLESLKAEMIKFHQQAEKNRKKETEETQLLEKLQSDIVELEKESSLKTEKIKALENEIIALKEKLEASEQANKNYSDEYLDFYEKELSKFKNDSESLIKEKELEWGREMEKILTECDEIKKLYLDIKSKKDEVTKKLAEVTQQYEAVKKEKSELESQLLKKQQDINQLEDHILNRKEKMPDESSWKEIQKELNNMVEKQNAEINMLKAKLQEVAKTDEELIRMKEEISNSKLRYIELEKTLKEEFQENLIKLKDENSQLRETILKKEAELSLRKMCVQIQKREVGIGTDDSLIIEVRNDQNLAEIEKLEKEIIRLRALDDAKAQEILRITSAHEHRLNEELQNLEAKLTAQHNQELLIAEKKMKEMSLKYFSEEMEKLQKQHADNLKALRDQDFKKITEFQQLIAKKDEEIRSLNARKEQLEAVLKRFEEERAKAGLIMTQWAREVDQIRQEKELLNENLAQLKESNAQLSQAQEELKLKLKETKKAALVYKRRLHEVKSSLSEKYKNLMIDLQKKVDDVVSAKEEEIREKLRLIENEYKNKEKLLHLDDRKSDVT